MHATLSGFPGWIDGLTCAVCVNSGVACCYNTLFTRVRKFPLSAFQTARMRTWKPAVRLERHRFVCTRSLHWATTHTHTHTHGHTCVHQGTFLPSPPQTINMVRTAYLIMPHVMSVWKTHRVHWEHLRFPAGAICSSWLCNTALMLISSAGKKVTGEEVEWWKNERWAPKLRLFTQRPLCETKRSTTTTLWMEVFDELMEMRGASLREEKQEQQNIYCWRDSPFFPS